MPQILVLNSETIDKIAAGEVVERPASVVKELVENAIDAGADIITVEAREGGISFLRVADNGNGIEPDQIRNAFLRHATSKIRDASDLNSIGSLGFRGEALSSISAVSQVEVITKTPEELMGIRYRIEGGVEKAYEQIGASTGTTFIIKNLFYNTPVRRKFLKQPATEGGYISDLMEHLALSRPDISFQFLLNGQMRFHTSGNGDLKEVIYRIYGRDVARELIPVQCTQGPVKLEGYLGKPTLIRSNRNFEIYFVNGRFIKSQLIAKAIEEGYKEYLMQHKFPFCVLHITVEKEDVDVNVHPTKMDVRFSDGQRFAACLMKAVKEALHGKEMIPEATLDEKEKKETSVVETQKEAVPQVYESSRMERFRTKESEHTYHADTAIKKEMIQNPVWSRIYADKKEDADPAIHVLQEQIKDLRERKKVVLPKEDDFFIEAEPIKKPVISLSKTVKSPDEKLQETDTKSQEIDVAPIHAAPAKEDATEKNVAAVEQLNLFDEKVLTKENRSRYRIIGQVFDTYWFVEFEEKLLIIDQHAAHEKVKYERLIRQFREKQVLSQVLMPPVIVSLTGQEAAILKEHENVFTSLGFEIEAFGGNEYALRSVPVDLYGCGEKELFLEVLDELAEGNFRTEAKSIEEKIASMSCKAAVKGNQRISHAETEQLIDELLALENPYHCPHGRPTIISMTKTEMEKKFKR